MALNKAAGSFIGTPKEFLERHLKSSKPLIKASTSLINMLKSKRLKKSKLKLKQKHQLQHRASQHTYLMSKLLSKTVLQLIHKRNLTQVTLPKFLVPLLHLLMQLQLKMQLKLQQKLTLKLKTKKQQSKQLMLLVIVLSKLSLRPQLLLHKSKRAS